MKITFGLLLFLLIGCTDNNSKSDKQILDFGSFSIVTPNSWTKIKTQEVDSYVGRIAMDNTDTLHFDLGRYSNKLNENDPTILDSNLIGSIDASMVDTSEVVFVKNKMRVDPDNYKKTTFRGTQLMDAKSKLFFQENQALV